MQLANKTVLVTGADGFIGSHLVETLVSSGSRVRAFVYYNSLGTRGWLDTLPREVLDEIEVVSGDIRDSDLVAASAVGIDVAFHLAALIGIPYSYRAPKSYVDTNIVGTLNILQAARDLGTERVVITSTSEVYGTALYAPIDEGHPLQGQSPYSASKIGADKIAESYWCSFSTPVVTARPFNTYGPRQSARAIIPTIISQLLGGAEELRLGATHPTRDFNFVRDTCDGFVALAECDEAVGRTVNIGTGKEISIGDLANMLIELIRPGVRVTSDAERMRPEASEVERLVADTRLIRELTGWEPKVGLREGLSETIEWLRDPANLRLYRWDSYSV